MTIIDRIRAWSMPKWAGMFFIAMPAMVLFTLVGYFLLGAMPGALLTGDLIAALAQLPIITVHAFAAVGLTWLFHRATFRDLDDDEENALRDILRSLDGDCARGALHLLYIDFLRWMVPLCVFAIFFFPQR